MYVNITYVVRVEPCAWPQVGGSKTAPHEALEGSELLEAGGACGHREVLGFKH